MHKGVKTKAEKALKAMGLSVSDAVRVLLTRVAVEKALPFDVRVPNAETRAAMKELEEGPALSTGGLALSLSERPFWRDHEGHGR